MRLREPADEVASRSRVRTVRDMARRVSTFYCEGVRLRSRQSRVRRGGRECAVVGTRREARLGEVPVEELLAGEKLYVEGMAAPLVWSHAAKQARKNRRFDAVSLRERLGAEAFSELLSVAGSNLGMSEDGESRVYAESVAAAFVRDAGVAGLATVLKEYPAVARSLRTGMLVEFLWGNNGALREIAAGLADTVTPGDVFGFESTAALMRVVPGCDAALERLSVVLERWGDEESATRLEEVLRELGPVTRPRSYAVSEEAAILRAELDAEQGVRMSAIRVGVLSTMTWVGVFSDGSVHLVRFRSEEPGEDLKRAEERSYRDVREAVSGARDGAGSFTAEELGALLVRATGVGTSGSALKV